MEGFEKIFDKQLENEDLWQLSRSRFVQEVGKVVKNNKLKIKLILLKKETTEFENIVLKIVYINIFHKSKGVLTMLAAIAYKIYVYLVVCIFIENIFKKFVKLEKLF